MAEDIGVGEEVLGAIIAEELFREKKDGEAPWMLTPGGLKHAKRTVGLTEDDVEKWAKEKYRVLDVGASFGVSMQQMRDLGVQEIYGIEPTFLYLGDPRIESMVESLDKKGVRERVFPVNAIDAQYVIPGGLESCDVVIAIGDNFQTYSASPNEFVAQLLGLVAVTKEGGHIIFKAIEGIGGRQTIRMIGNSKRGNSVPNLTFDLESYLTDKGIKFEIREGARDDEPGPDKMSGIWIEKTSDLSKILLSSLKNHELSEYTTYDNPTRGESKSNRTYNSLFRRFRRN